MDKLNRMLLREIAKSRGQFIAAAAVIFAGIVMFSAAFMSYKNLKNSLDYYYDQYSFLDYYAEVQNISAQGIEKVREIDGVKDAVGRITMDVGADMGNDRKVTIRLISLPDKSMPDINKVRITAGGYFDRENQNSCLVSSKFANFYRLGKGSAINSIINLEKYEFTVDGIVNSPEFIYAMKSSTDVSPSAEGFGVVYIKESTARSILGYGDSFNEVHITFEKGVNAKHVIDRIEEVLKPYGFINGIQRKDQLSNGVVDNEIKELEKIAYMFPVLFLGVAAMIIYIMQRRVINNQRTLIGVIKAFGYTNLRIMGHYIMYCLLVALAGTIPALAAGLLLGVKFTTLYNRIFDIPVMQVRVYWDIFAVGIGLSMAFCLMAGYSASKRILGIQPAQAMRSEAPKSGSRVFLERIGFIWGRLHFGWKMSIRNIFRNRQRTVFTVFGIMLTIMFFMVSLFFLDSIGYILYQNFSVFQKQDYKVTFSRPAALEDVRELKYTEGVSKVEPIAEVPIEIKKGWMKQETMLVGLEKSNSLYKLVDQGFSTAAVPEQGILIAHSIARKLGIRPGDSIKVKLLMGSLEEKDVKVTGIVKQYAGFNCYMNIKELGDIADEGCFANGALIKVKKGMGSKAAEELFKLSGVMTVTSRSNALEDFKQFVELLYTFVGFMIFFGTIMGFAIIFNSTVINIMERRRELASLKVLGYTEREVEYTILRENVMLCLSALLPGALLGKTVCGILGRLFSNKSFALEVVIYPRTFIITFASVFAFVILAQLANRKNISGLDMVEVLKNREG